MKGGNFEHNNCQTWSSHHVRKDLPKRVDPNATNKFLAVRTAAQTCWDNFVEQSAKCKRFWKYSDAFKDVSQKIHNNRKQGMGGSMASALMPLQNTLTKMSSIIQGT